MKISKARLKEIIKEEVQSFKAHVEENESPSKEVLYSKAKQQIEEILNKLWDDLDVAGVPNGQEVLNKLMAHLQKDMDAGFVGEPT